MLETTPQRVAVLEVASLRVRDVSASLQREFGDADIRGRRASELLVGGPSEAAPLLATGKIDGYELTRKVRLPNGIEMAHVWVHALGDERPPRLAVVVIDLDDGGDVMPTPGNSGAASIIGTVDNEWRIDRVSVDSYLLLGHEADALRGLNILTLIHPNDLGEFLTGLGHSQAVSAGVALRLRLLRAGGGWRWMRVKVSPLGNGAAFAFVVSPVEPGKSGAESAVELEQRLGRIAREVHSVRTARATTNLPSLESIPLLGRLTSREWEIASLVRSGKSIDDVAKTLHLSASTVRNHLSAIYRKLGVRSLAQMLVLLHESDGSTAAAT
jgi:PAS domain S-box-containing protein